MDEIRQRSVEEIYALKIMTGINMLQRDEGGT